MPAALKLGGALSLGVFYALIGPTGDALIGGWGNLAGVAIAVGAAALRYVVRHGVPGVRHPTVSVRLLFYAALPLAVGVPWGWAALTAPALMLAAYRTRLEERMLGEKLGPAYLQHLRATRRWIPGIW